jgi:hypothetical protein
MILSFWQVLLTEASLTEEHSLPKHKQTSTLATTLPLILLTSAGTESIAVQAPFLTESR